MTEALAAAATSRKRRALRGSIFELGTHGIQVVVRLASSLITTRLLYPAAFGEASIVWALSTALVMFSDVALAPMIIQSKRGDDPDFLNTAFTVQAVRGGVIGAVMCLLAQPVAWFYHDPAVAPLILLGSAQLFIGAFHSTSIYSLRRSLKLGWLNAFELSQTLVTIVCTISFAWYFRKAWTIVGGTIVGVFIFTVVSHFLPVPYKNRFRWERKALDEIRTFGRWILGSSAAGFVSGQADRILLGRFLGTTTLGVYGIAIVISDAVMGAVTRLVTGVMFPVLTEAGRQEGADVGDLYYKVRKRLDLLSMGATGVLAGLGGWFVHFLWDSRYADAAWMLQIVFVRVGVAALVSAGENCLFALGHSHFVFRRSIARLVGIVICLPAGWLLGGVKGLIWGSVVAECAALAVVWAGARSLGILRVSRELRAVAIFAACFAVGRLLLPWLPDLHLR